VVERVGRGQVRSLNAGLCWSGLHGAAFGPETPKEHGLAVAALAANAQPSLPNPNGPHRLVVVATCGFPGHKYGLTLGLFWLYKPRSSSSNGQGPAVWAHVGRHRNCLKS
jgi:hypothetical protein